MTTLEAHANPQCQICGRLLPPYRGHGRPRAYCLPESGQHYSNCEQEARRQAQERFDSVLDPTICTGRLARARIRQFLQRLRNTARSTLPRGVIEAYLEGLSSTRTAYYEKCFTQLEQAKKQLVSGQLSPDAVANAIETLQISIDSWADKNATRARLYIACEELLRDIGEQGDSAEACRQLLQRSVKVERYWARENEPLQLAKALLTHVAILRLEIDRNPSSLNIHYPVAMRLLAVIEYVLRKQGSKRDAESADRLDHHAVALKLRLIAHHEGTLRYALKERRRLHDLARSLNSPHTWMSTYQEEAAALLLCQEVDAAAECLQATKRFLTEDPASRSPQAQLALLRREIELQLTKRKLWEAQLQIHNYHKLLQQYPNAYYLRHLNRWVHKYRLGSISPPTLAPAYSTGMVYHFYCEEGLSK